MRLKIFKVGIDIVKIIFVDAYNVINSWPNFKNIKDLDFDIIRDKLINVIENYAVFNGYKIFLIFDAYNSNSTGERKLEISDNLSVIYTNKDEFADTYIEKIVHNTAKKVEIIVVTSDFMEQQIIFQRGAYRMSSLEFYDDVHRVNKKINKEINENNYKNSGFLFVDNLSDDIVQKLENIRRIK
ncbi:NYN domain-containing protein [Candidatus Arthromitus sp. SFB-rat-Yit]|uniref:NYN domain-containing protein n=1 Tax=Candidatus Arthromitus sp. SFB-rat-Yit TaxID=1041504 RepID=UPI000227A81D|nr:NYN domain-containing protein [Candidatus Arthromitus sp. SFB-rat-Yit]BAK81803.1 tetracycline resistance protein [Candidatus Arthromitus sp. SFB-rat-Yit]